VKLNLVFEALKLFYPFPSILGPEQG